MPGPALRVAQIRPPCASTIERQIDNPMPRPLGLVVKNALKSCFEFFRIDADTGILDRHEHLVGIVELRSDEEFARASGDSGHGLGAVDDEIDDHLLQLDAIALHRRQLRRKLQPHRRMVGDHFALHEGDHIADDLVYFEPDHLRTALLGEIANAVDHVARAVCATDNSGEGIARLSNVWSVTAQPSEAGLSVEDDRRQRLNSSRARSRRSSRRASSRA